VQDVSDGFLLQMAEISGGLFGLFMVGMLFFVETGFSGLAKGRSRQSVISYFRASTRIVVLLFAIPLALSLTLVVLDETWSVVLFAVFGLALIAANVDTARQIPAVRKETGSATLLANEIVGTIAVVVIIAVPWILGGIDPSREDLTWSILVAFGAAFLSLFTLVMSVFDIAMSRR
jgi:hypothetical protein